MKIVTLIVRILLGLIFVVFGSNGFLHFLPMGSLPQGAAGKFLSALFESHYVPIIAAIQVVSGVLLLANRYVPLAITLLGPIIVNILLFHLLMSLSGISVAIVVAIFWAILAVHYRQYFISLFVQRAS
jgi:putative oxidoreductase